MTQIENSIDDESHLEVPCDHSRRQFLVRVSGLVVGAAILQSTRHVVAAPRKKIKLAGPLSAKDRKTRSKAVYSLKKNLAVAGYKQPFVPLALNGDEVAFPTGLAACTKSLPHDDNGIVNPAAYQALRDACAVGTVPAFEAVPGGGLAQLKNPMAAYAYTTAGTDSHNTYLPAPPALASAEQAAEAAEAYWHARLRDVPFTQYNNHPLVHAACGDLTAFSDFRGPRVAGAVTPQVLFRGTSTGEQEGPYLSQFLLKDMLMGHTPMEQKYLCAVPGSDYIKTWDSWLALQRGHVPPLDVPFMAGKRYLATGRDIAHHAHLDFPYQTAMAAALAMNLLGVPPNSSSPYLALRRQCGFGTFGPPDVMAAVAQVSNLAIKAAWRHKWTLHRRLRPEEFGARLHQGLNGAFEFPAHEQLVGSVALQEAFSENGNYLVTQAYPEGAPCHPAYPSGHATFIGACVTVLKAFYEETSLVANPVVPSEDGETLVPYSGPALTVGGELNKLASNVAFARNFAGVHWRTDALEGNRLGERVAISYLADLKACYREEVLFRFTTFDGISVLI